MDSDVLTPLGSVMLKIKWGLVLFQWSIYCQSSNYLKLHSPHPHKYQNLSITGEQKKLQFYFFIIQLKLWWYFSGIILDYTYERKLHSKFHCLHQKPPQFMRVTKLSVTGQQKLLKMPAILSASRPVPATKNDIWH